MRRSSGLAIWVAALVILTIAACPSPASASPSPTPAPSSSSDQASPIPALVPADAQGYMNAGFAFERGGDHKGAIEQFTRAISADPALIDAYSARAAVRDEIDDRANAISD